MTCLRILVVDDNEDAAESLAGLLQLQGHRVEVAHDSDAALRTAERLRPDVVLLDLGMPRVNGYEICRRLRAQPWGGQPAVVAVTGWGEAEDLQRTEAAGFDGHCLKPVDLAELVRVLAEVRERGARTGRQNAQRAPSENARGAPGATKTASASPPT